MATSEAPALRALLEHFIDYAGLFPPAALDLGRTVENYKSYSAGHFSWMLRSLVVPEKDLANVPDSFGGTLAVLGEQDNARAASMETKSVISAGRPVYCEVAANDSAGLDAIKAAGCFAKIRTGGLKPEAIPSAAEVATFIVACAERRLPFKATAGLHHPLRSMQPLTYEDNAPQAVMHGFINVLMAAAFAWQGEKNIEPILAETDPSAFSFGQSASWRGKTIDTEKLKEMRRDFMHSVGSCSFDEPVGDLQTLGLLPDALAAKSG